MIWIFRGCYAGIDLFICDFPVEHDLSCDLECLHWSCDCLPVHTGHVTTKAAPRTAILFLPWWSPWWLKSVDLFFFSFFFYSWHDSIAIRNYRLSTYHLLDVPPSTCLNFLDPPTEEHQRDITHHTQVALLAYGCLTHLWMFQATRLHSPEERDSRR